MGGGFKKKETGYAVWISDYAPAYTEKVREYLDLLKISMPEDESKDLVLPIYFAVAGRGVSGLAISTRPTFDLIQIIRAAIQILQEHTKSCVAISYPAMSHNR
jgi:hypothetical protein